MTTLLEPLGVPEVSDVILSKLELQDLLRLRQTNRAARSSADERLRRMYFKIYQELSTDIPIGPVIRKLKEAIYPPFRQGGSQIHVGDFSYPDGSDLEDFNLRVRGFIIKEEIEEVKKWENEHLNDPDLIDQLKSKYGSIEISQEIDFAYECLADDTHSEYYDEKKKELNLDDLDEDWYSDWVYHFVKKDEVYDRVMSGFNETEFGEILSCLVHDGLEVALESSDCFAQYYRQEHTMEYTTQSERMRYIAHVIETDPRYKVGDYFFHYNFHLPSRQQYGIDGVGYDIKTEKKVPIFDGEGYPEWPEWLHRQFELSGTQLAYPDDFVENINY